MDTLTLLLVEDEPLLALDFESALTEAGYTVVVAASGEKALAELVSDATRFCAVLTDIRIGIGPNGWAVGKRARELVPGIPVIYMSGDSSADSTSMGVPESIMLAKPMAMSQVIVALAQLMNAQHP